MKLIRITYKHEYDEDIEFVDYLYSYKSNLLIESKLREIYYTQYRLNLVSKLIITEIADEEFYFLIKIEVLKITSSVE